MSNDRQVPSAEYNPKSRTGTSPLVPSDAMPIAVVMLAITHGFQATRNACAMAVRLFVSAACRQ